MSLLTFGTAQAMDTFLNITACKSADKIAYAYKHIRLRRPTLSVQYASPRIITGERHTSP